MTDILTTFVMGLQGGREGGGWVCNAPLVMPRMNCVREKSTPQRASARYELHSWSQRMHNIHCCALQTAQMSYVKLLRIGGRALQLGGALNLRGAVTTERVITGRVHCNSPGEGGYNPCGQRDLLVIMVTPLQGGGGRGPRLVTPITAK